MTSVHKIRLAGPWEFVQGSRESNSPERCILPYPPVDALPGSSETVSAERWLIRRFHRPGGLTDRSSLQVLLESREPLRRVLLNGQALNQAGWMNAEDCCSTVVARYDIPLSVPEFNVLSIDARTPDGSAQNELISATLQITEAPDA